MLAVSSHFVQVTADVAQLLGEQKVDAILCAAGGWAGGNCSSKGQSSTFFFFIIICFGVNNQPAFLQSPMHNCELENNLLCN